MSPDDHTAQSWPQKHSRSASLRTLDNIDPELAATAQPIQNGAASGDSAMPRTSSRSPLTSPAEASKSDIWGFDPIHPTLYYGQPDGSWSLPPLEEIEPMIDDYFKFWNPSMPLFNQSSFMRMVTRWFSRDPKHDSASWAAILVVVGLGLQSAAFPGNNSRISPGKTKDWIDYCMRHAQSVVPELVVRDQDLLGVQVLVGTAMLFRNSFDIRPSSILLGMAIRLAHRMQLHYQESAQYFTQDEALERSNVFWVTYILDKDICLKTKTPSMLSDSDISISFDSQRPSNQTSVLWAKDRGSQFDIFGGRLELARIEGKVYDLLYSSHFLTLEPSARQSRVEKLDKMLTEWYNQIPSAFKLDTAASVLDSAELLQLSMVYHIYLACLVSSHGVWSSKTDWMERIGALGRAAVEDFAAASYGPKVLTCVNAQNPPLPQAWDTCVNASRRCVELFQSTTPSQCLLWQGTCAHFSGLIVLLANIISYPVQPSAPSDLELVKASMAIYNQELHSTPSIVYDSLKLVIDVLSKRAKEIVDNFLSEEEALISASAGIGTGPALFAESERMAEFPYYEEQMSSFTFDDLISGDGVVDSLNSPDIRT